MIIHTCTKEEIPQLIEFLRHHWNAKHVLVNHPELLLWQYKNSDGGLDFILAKDEKDDTILAILGFIPLDHFDSNLALYRETWGAIWKVSPDCKIPGLGTYLQKKICEQYDFYAGLGLSMDSIHIQRSLSTDILSINQYFILNPNIKKHHIASIPDNFIPNPIYENCNFEIQKLSDISHIELEHAYAPKKSITFLKNRYQDHPWYHYKFLGCFIENKIQCILIYRKITIESYSVIRIIDIYGNLEKLFGLGQKLQKYFFTHFDIEYIDICNYGIRKEYFIENGFNLLDSNSTKIIIPNYFEPFEKRNIALKGVIYSKKEKNYTFFKGDADQDRPNIL